MAKNDTIKNWTVVTERVKDKANGLQTYQSYLNAVNHKNHKNTEIIPITDNGAEFFAYASKNAMQRDLDIEKARKGGRKIESYAQGFNLTLPHEFQPTANQWKMIFLKVRNELKEHLEIDNTCFYANVHKENKKNSHLNILISRCHNAKVIEKLDQKNTIVKIKDSFTQAVLDICEISPSMYQKKSNKKTSKRLSRNAYQYKLKREEIKLKTMNSFNNIVKTMNDKNPLKDEFIQLDIKDLKDLKNIKFEFDDDLKNVDKLPKLK